MVRSRRSISKEDASSVLADSGISLSSPSPPTVLLQLTKEEEEALIEQLCVTDSEDDSTGGGHVVAAEAKAKPAKRAAVGHGAAVNTKAVANAKAVTNAKAKQQRRVAAPVGRKRKQPQKQPQKKDEEDDDTDDDYEPPSETDTDSDSDTDTDTDTEPDLDLFDEPLAPTPPPPKKKSRKWYLCYVCDKGFGGKTDLKRHMLIHSDERPHKCPQCGKSYRQGVNLKNHITVAHEQKKCFACAQCPKTFALKERLRLHMRVHSGEKPYECTLCDKRFARGGQLRHHVVTHHKSIAKKYNCDKCSAILSTPANLRAHMERHFEGPEHLCEICNEYFVNEILLRAHINKVHYKLKEFACDVCQQTIQNEDLATHMKQHAHVKAHICEVCNSYFIQKSQYNVHMRMHTGERPYQCRICWQTFAHSSVLKLHIRKHTGEKPFSCPLCTKDEVAFSQLPHLKTHMKKIHNQDKPYMCEGCNTFFKIKVELQAHMDECSDVESVPTSSPEEQKSINDDLQTLSQLRFLIAVLLKKISSEQKLKQLGFEKRLIDNVVVASLKLANRRTHDDSALPAIKRLRLNAEEFLNWIVPDKVMEGFRSEQLPVDDILDKIVALYMKQK